MSAHPTTLALIFDFDDTIAPDTTTHLLETYDIDAEQFWQEEFTNHINNGYDPTVAYLTQILSRVGKNEPLEDLTYEGLQDVGGSLNELVFDGLEGLFEDLENIVSAYENIEIKYFIISEGLKEIIKGTEIADKFDTVYGSEFSYTDGEIDGFKKTISFTDKTRYLFEINKGIDPTLDDQNPYGVNERYSSGNRSVPFENMVYIGDGLTDVPCFSLIKKRQGRAFGVYHKESPSPKQKAIKEIGAPQRAESLNPPQYSPDDRLGSLIRLTVEGLCTERTIDQMEALYES